MESGRVIILWEFMDTRMKTYLTHGVWSKLSVSGGDLYVQHRSTISSVLDRGIARVPYSHDVFDVIVAIQSNVLTKW